MFIYCVFSRGLNNIVSHSRLQIANSLSASDVGWWSWPLSTTWGIYRRVTAKSCWWSWGRIWSLKRTISRGRCWTSTPGHTETLMGARRLTISPAPSCVSSNESGVEKERVLPSDLPPCKYSYEFFFCFVFLLLFWIFLSWQCNCSWIFKLPLVQCFYSLLEFSFLN